eukprot:328804_1
MSQRGQPGQPIQPYLWPKTYLNLRNVANVHLYITRRTSNSAPHGGSRPISLQPCQYLGALKRYDIPLDSLNIPTTCPQYDINVLQKDYHLTDAQIRQANDTVRLLWNIIQSHVQIQSANVDGQMTSNNCNNEHDHLSSKLDRVIKACGLDEQYNYIQKLEQENHQTKMENNALQQEVMQATQQTHDAQQQTRDAQQTIGMQEQQIHKLQKERRRITNLKNYYKKVASEQRRTLKCVGLVCRGRVIAMCGYKQLRRRVRFLECYMKEAFNIDSACVNKLLCKYVILHKDVSQYFSRNVFFPKKKKKK